MISPETFEYWYKAEVKEVYDGDSITVDISLGCHAYLHGRKVRLKDINTPELRLDTKAAGIVSRDYLRSLVLGKEVIINTYIDSSDKYGRLLGIVYVDGVNVNALMIKSGYAVPY